MVSTTRDAPSLGDHPPQSAPKNPRTPLRQTRSALIGAGLAAIATAAVGVIALMGVSHIPIGEYLLFPGSWVAWLYKGDNYRSGHEFLLHSIAFGVPINAVAGSILGATLAFLRRKPEKKLSRD